MSLGESVVVFTRSNTGEDSMGEPVFEWTQTTVDNVLVRPLSGAELTTGDTASSVSVDGVKVKYRLAFPKTYEGDNLAHARVALVDRGMEANPDTAYLVSGSPDITAPCPTDWNMLVEIGTVHG